MSPLPRGKIRFGQGGVYAQGGAAGFTPREVDAMSLWEFAAVLGGVAAFHGADQDGLTREDVAELGALLDAVEGTRH